MGAFNTALRVFDIFADKFIEFLKSIGWLSDTPESPSGFKPQPDPDKFKLGGMEGNEPTSPNPITPTSQSDMSLVKVVQLLGQLVKIAGKNVTGGSQRAFFPSK
jgi:hypothetical protein